MRLEKLKSWLQRQDIAYLGMVQEANSIYMIALACHAEYGYEIIWQNQLAEDVPSEELWEKACLLAAGQLGENTVCCLGLSQQEVYFYEKFFPELPDRELSKAIKLDFASAAAWQEAYLWGYAKLADGNMRIGGIRKKDMEQKAQPCRQFFDVVQGVLICGAEWQETSQESINLPTMWNSWPLGMQEAFEAAFCGAANTGLLLGKVPAYQYQWHWLKMSKLLWGAGIAVCILATALGWYNNLQAEKELKAKEQAIQLLSDVAQRQEAIECDKAVIAGRSKLLADIQKSNEPAYGMLVRLGTSLEDGIWLTGLKLENGQVQLQGRAAAYNQVAHLLDSLAVQGQEADDKKEKGMVLDTADTGQDGIVDFQLKGRMF